MTFENKHPLFEKLNNFIKRFYKNQLIKGAIYFISVSTIFFIIFSTIEYFSKLNVTNRTVLFWLYILINGSIAITYIIVPLLNLFRFGKRLTHKQAAKIIGSHFNEVEDKLLNVLELQEMRTEDNDLINASVQQKTNMLAPIPFSKVIKYGDNKKHMKWIGYPVAIILLFIISGKQYILTESSARILNHNTFFEPKAPFQYVVLNQKLEAIQYDNYTLKIKITGNQIPKEVFIKTQGDMFKLTDLGNNTFNYEFRNITKDVVFNFFAGGYNSPPYIIKCLSQPKVVSLETIISPPKYTEKEEIKNSSNGDLIILEGSYVSWNVKFKNTSNSSFFLNKKLLKESKNDKLHFKKQLFKNTTYSIISRNKNNLTDTLTYQISIIPDKYPTISLESSYDSISLNHIFNGHISDDYLIDRLEFIYSTSSNNDSLTSTDISIEGLSSERFLHNFNFHSLNLAPGKKINYYFKVWDNDHINGSKFSKSKTFTYAESSIEDLIKVNDLQNTQTKNGINNSISLAKEIKHDIQELSKKLLEKKEIGFEEKQKARDILNKQKKLEEKIINTQKKHSENITIKEKLNSSITEKQKQLDQLINKIFDEDMKKLLEEMDKLLDNTNKEKLKDLLEKLDKENADLEKELDRDLELFKQLEFEQKTEEVLDKIAELKTQQNQLKKATEQGDQNKNELTKKQDNLTKQMDLIKKELDDLRQKNMALENKNKMPKTQELENSIKQKMQESKSALQKGRKIKSKNKQEQILNELEELESGLKKMQQNNSKNKPIENMETLRKILENLITLSFEQENLMALTIKNPVNSPKFITLIQEQNKLSNDSEIIKDSLIALSKRVVQIQATINKEISSINTNLNKTTAQLEAREIKKAAERQQFIMTSSNNLALLLSEILEQMQRNLDLSSSSCNKPKNCNKPNPNSKQPSMSELKDAQQKLNKKLNKKGKGKKGKGNEQQSKELIHLARQQEEIRRQLMDLRDDIGKNGEKGKIDKVLENMEKTEVDIINNTITEQTIQRQKEILTRLLEAENAKREQGEEEKRMSQEWKYVLKNTSELQIKYLKQKKEQEELLKTTPIQLTPFYKNKVTNYFKKTYN